MGQGEVDFVVPAPRQELSDVRVRLTRVPFCEYFVLHLERGGRDVTEELEADSTRAWFKARFKKAASMEQEKAREESLERALDECWNFYETVVTIPGDVYTEPSLPFPQFQPKV